MASFKGIKAAVSEKMRWLRDKVLRRKAGKPAAEERSGATKAGIVIGEPYNFRREAMSFPACEHTADIIEAAREDAMKMHQKAK